MSLLTLLWAEVELETPQGPFQPELSYDYCMQQLPLRQFCPSSLTFSATGFTCWAGMILRRAEIAGKVWGTFARSLMSCHPDPHGHPAECSGSSACASLCRAGFMAETVGREVPVLLHVLGGNGLAFCCNPFFPSLSGICSDICHAAGLRLAHSDYYLWLNPEVTGQLGNMRCWCLLVWTKGKSWPVQEQISLDICHYCWILAQCLQFIYSFSPYLSSLLPLLKKIFFRCLNKWLCKTHSVFSLCFCPV